MAIWKIVSHSSGSSTQSSIASMSSVTMPQHSVYNAAIGSCISWPSEMLYIERLSKRITLRSPIIPFPASNGFFCGSNARWPNQTLCNTRTPDLSYAMVGFCGEVVDKPRSKRICVKRNHSGEACRFALATSPHRIDNHHEGYS
jgi:hypothetical protein